MTNREKGVMLEIITPAGVVAGVECDSVHLQLADDQKGKGGGSYGIRSGHADAVLLLAEGITVGQADNREVLIAKTGKGFATVSGGAVSVIVDSGEVIKA